jgi:Zn finger protein HypA/HybF involved in hydrogenase expression
MNKTISVIILIVGGLMLGCGLLFLCASAAAPQKTIIRFLLALLLIVIGGAGAAWAGMTWRRLSEIEPKRLADRIVEMVRLQAKSETTAAEAVAGLSAPAANVEAALEVLASRGEVVQEQREDRRVYVFPNLKESKVERRCPYCGAQFPVKLAITQCPNCGANIELKRT